MTIRPKTRPDYWIEKNLRNKDLMINSVMVPLLSFNKR